MMKRLEMIYVDLLQNNETYERIIKIAKAFGISHHKDVSKINQPRHHIPPLTV